MSASPAAASEAAGAAVDSERQRPRVPDHVMLEHLCAYAFIGDTVLVKESLQSRFDINKLGIAGWSPLHEAINGGHLSVVELLCQAGADCQLQSKTGKTPLQLAADSGHVNIMLLLHNVVTNNLYHELVMQRNKNQAMEVQLSDLKEEYRRLFSSTLLPKVAAPTPSQDKTDSTTFRESELQHGSHRQHAAEIASNGSTRGQKKQAHTLLQESPLEREAPRSFLSMRHLMQVSEVMHLLRCANLHCAFHKWVEVVSKDPSATHGRLAGPFT